VAIHFFDLTRWRRTLKVVREIFSVPESRQVLTGMVLVLALFLVRPGAQRLYARESCDRSAWR